MDVFLSELSKRPLWKSSLIFVSAFSALLIKSTQISQRFWRNVRAFDAETYSVKSVCEHLINWRDSVKRDSIKQRDFVQRYSVSVRTFVCYLIGLEIDAETTR